MFKVEFRFQGAGLWSTGMLPTTQLGAVYTAGVMRDLGLADETRVVPTRPLSEQGVARALDLKI